MKIEKEKIEALCKKFNKEENDTGATEVQIGIFSERINNITSHLKTNKKDHSARRGLVNLVSQRKKMLTYLKRKEQTNYEKVIKELGIRK